MTPSALQSVAAAAADAAPGLFDDEHDLEEALASAAQQQQQEQEQADARERGDSLLSTSLVSTGSVLSRVTMRGVSGEEELFGDDDDDLAAAEEKEGKSFESTRRPLEV